MKIKRLNEFKKEVFDRDDEDYNQDHLEAGAEIQKEHEPTYKRIKKFLELTGELPPEEEVYKSIAKDHMDEPDGIGELYYDEDEGLEDFEDELKDKWKEMQEEDDDDDDDDDELNETNIEVGMEAEFISTSALKSTKKKYEEEFDEHNIDIDTKFTVTDTSAGEVGLEYGDLYIKVPTKDLSFEKINETVNHDIVEDLMQKIRDRYTEEEIHSMIDEQMMDYIDEDWSEDGEYESEYEWYLEHGRNAAEYDILQQIINSVSTGDISIDDNSEIFNQIADEYGINI
jgi:hypothetical protein